MLTLFDILGSLILISLLIFTVYLLCLCISEDREAGSYPGRLPEHEAKDDEQC